MWVEGSKLSFLRLESKQGVELQVTRLRSGLTDVDLHWVLAGLKSRQPSIRRCTSARLHCQWHVNVSWWAASFFMWHDVVCRQQYTLSCDIHATLVSQIF